MLLLETVEKEERHRTYGNDVCYHVRGVDRVMTFDEFQEFARKNWSMSVVQVLLSTNVDWMSTMSVGKKLLLGLWLKSYHCRTMRNHRLFILGLYSICGYVIIRYEILGLGVITCLRNTSYRESSLMVIEIIV